MKNLIILLLPVLCFSQKCIVLGQQRQKTVQSSTIAPIISNNQIGEIPYLVATLLPIAEKANLQSALDTYGSIRLEKGDYSGVNIVLHSNQKLYGHSTLTQVSNITIAAGSTNVHLEDVYMLGATLLFESGGVISNSTIKNIKWATMVANNVMLENNTFINMRCNLSFNCSASGYIRNNKMIRTQSGYLDAYVMKGNDTTPSYGNINLWTNFLTPAGNTTDISNLQSTTFVGLDAEGWNYDNTGTNPLLYMRNMGNVKITDFGGGNGYSANPTATFDIDANNLFFLNKIISGTNEPYGSPVAKVTPNTDVTWISGVGDNFTRSSGTVTGFDLKAHVGSTGWDNNTTFNGNVASTITDPTIKAKVTNSILGTQYTPWARPTWETLPDPLGGTWATDRIGKPDSTSFIQNLINTNGIAELPEGVYYISSTLSVFKDGLHGVVGAGTGKTVICGLTDDFPLISLVQPVSGYQNFIVSNLTLQGGSVGIYSPDSIGQIAFTYLKYIVFRNQNYGIQLYRNFGLDNCFFDNLSFVNCNIGFFQDAQPGGNYAYVDKVVFYGGQFLNCGIGAHLYGYRAGNLNMWVGCKFDGNTLAIDMSGNNLPAFANCDFTNNNGEHTILGEMSLYNCKFQNNIVSKSTFMSNQLWAEGCNFLDNSPMFPSEIHHNVYYYILNSTITGDVIRNFGFTNAVYSNSTLLSNPTLSKMLVSMKNNVPTVILDATPNPYPQLLVTQ